MKEETPNETELSIVDDSATDPFKLYLQSKAGYVRRLDERDKYHKYYESGLFGFFTSEGELIAAREHEEVLFMRAKQFGYTPYSIH